MEGSRHPREPTKKSQGSAGQRDVLCRRRRADNSPTSRSSGNHTEARHESALLRYALRVARKTSNSPREEAFALSEGRHLCGNPKRIPALRYDLRSLLNITPLHGSWEPPTPDRPASKKAIRITIPSGTKEEVAAAHLTTMPRRKGTIAYTDG